MVREIDIVKHLPEIIRDIKEIQAITKSENIMLTSILVELKNLMDDQFIQTATLTGVARREKILKITPKATDKLEERRFRILARMNEQLPNTFRTLQQQLKNLCGEDGYKISLNHNEYTLIVKVALTAKSNFEDVGHLLDRVVPANLIIDLTLLYNQHSTLAQFTHQQLKIFTHEQLRNEVLI